MAQYAEQDIDIDRLERWSKNSDRKIMKWLEEHATIELVPEGSLNALRWILRKKRVRGPLWG